MNNPFRIFKIQKEERPLAALVFLLLVLLNGVVVACYAPVFTGVTDNFYKQFITHFQVSGFDPLTYWVLSDWSAAYNVYRHPLLAFYMYPPYLLNMALMKLTGVNCALFIAVALQMFCAFYAMVFLRRIFREVISVGRWGSEALTLLFFGFAYVMVTAIVPDHFVISMLLLILALYISGRRIKNHHPFKIWQSVVYFLLTAGTSLNNGLKIFLSALFVNGKRFFRPAHLVLAILLPAALLWGFCRWEYRTYVWPTEMAKKAAKAKAKKAATKKTVVKKKKKGAPKQGKPMMNGEFMRWTDATTSRTQSVVDNLFGEGIQLHEDYLLEDELRGNSKRPMFVSYRHWWSYAVEAAVLVLFMAGIWAGRRSRFLWLALSWFGLDMLLHIGLGFGLNEVYIMTAHWIYVLPIAIAYLYRGLSGRGQKCLTAILGALALYLIAYNGSLIVSYFT